MSGTVNGAAKIKAGNLARDPDFYKKIGALGGKAGHTGGFYANRKLASEAGRRGGLKTKETYKTRSHDARL